MNIVENVFSDLLIDVHLFVLEVGFGKLSEQLLGTESLVDKLAI